MSLLGRNTSLPINSKSAHIAVQNLSRAMSKEASSSDEDDVCLPLKTLSLSKKRPSNEDDNVDLSAASTSVPNHKNYLVMYCRARSSSESNLDKLIQLKSEFEKESHKNYLSDVQRLDYKVTCKNGFMYDAKGILLSGAFTYVLLPGYELYAAPVEAKKHHSYFNGGLPVRGAGVMYVQCGLLLNVSNESGHYTPTFDEMMGALKWFSKKLKGLSYLFEDHSRQDKDKEFNGILYYNLAPASDKERYEMTLLENAKLVPTLFNVKDAAMKLFLQERSNGTLFPQKPVTNASTQVHLDSEDDDGAAYTTEITLETLLKPVNGPDVFENPDLLKHLCLQNVGREIFSYYGCHLKSAPKMQ